MSFKKVRIKNCTCYYFDDIIQLEDFDIDILIDEKFHENILIYFSPYFSKIKIDCYNSLPIEKRLTLYNVIKL